MLTAAADSTLPLGHGAYTSSGKRCESQTSQWGWADDSGSRNSQFSTFDCDGGAGRRGIAAKRGQTWQGAGVWHHHMCRWHHHMCKRLYSVARIHC